MQLVEVVSKGNSTLEASQVDQDCTTQAWQVPHTSTTVPNTQRCSVDSLTPPPLARLLDVLSARCCTWLLTLARKRALNLDAAQCYSCTPACQFCYFLRPHALGTAQLPRTATHCCTMYAPQMPICPIVHLALTAQLYFNQNSFNLLTFLFSFIYPTQNKQTHKKEQKIPENSQFHQVKNTQFVGIKLTHHFSFG